MNIISRKTADGGRFHILYVEHEGQTYDISVFYEQGGMNYISGTANRRGIYISVKPVELSDGWVRFRLFEGYKEFIEAWPRYNGKKLQAIADRIFNNPDGDERVMKLLNACGVKA